MDAPDQPDNAESGGASAPASSGGRAAVARVSIRLGRGPGSGAEPEPSQTQEEDAAEGLEYESEVEAEEDDEASEVEGIALWFGEPETPEALLESLGVSLAPEEDGSEEDTAPSLEEEGDDRTGEWDLSRSLAHIDEIPGRRGPRPGALWAGGGDPLTLEAGEADDAPDEDDGFSLAEDLSEGEDSQEPEEDEPEEGALAPGPSGAQVSARGGAADSGRDAVRIPLLRRPGGVRAAASPSAPREAAQPSPGIPAGELGSGGDLPEAPGFTVTIAAPHADEEGLELLGALPTLGADPDLDLKGAAGEGGGLGADAGAPQLGRGAAAPGGPSSSSSPSSLGEVGPLAAALPPRPLAMASHRGDDAIDRALEDELESVWDDQTGEWVIPSGEIDDLPEGALLSLPAEPAQRSDDLDLSGFLDADGPETGREPELLSLPFSLPEPLPQGPTPSGAGEPEAAFDFLALDLAAELPRVSSASGGDASPVLDHARLPFFVAEVPEERPQEPAAGEEDLLDAILADAAALPEERALPFPGEGLEPPEDVPGGALPRLTGIDLRLASPGLDPAPTLEPAGAPPQAPQHAQGAPALEDAPPLQGAPEPDEAPVSPEAAELPGEAPPAPAPPAPPEHDPDAAPPEALALRAGRIAPSDAEAGILGPPEGPLPVLEVADAEDLATEPSPGPVVEVDIDLSPLKGLFDDLPEAEDSGLGDLFEDATDVEAPRATGPLAATAPRPEWIELDFELPPNAVFTPPPAAPPVRSAPPLPPEPTDELEVSIARLFGREALTHTEGLAQDLSAPEGESASEDEEILDADLDADLAAFEAALGELEGPDAGGPGADPFALALSELEGAPQDPMSAALAELEGEAEVRWHSGGAPADVALDPLDLDLPPGLVGPAAQARGRAKSPPADPSAGLWDAPRERRGGRPSEPPISLEEGEQPWWLPPEVDAPVPATREAPAPAGEDLWASVWKPVDMGQARGERAAQERPTAQGASAPPTARRPASAPVPDPFDPLEEALRVIQGDDGGRGAPLEDPAEDLGGDLEIDEEAQDLSGFRPRRRSLPPRRRGGLSRSTGSPQSGPAAPEAPQRSPRVSDRRQSARVLEVVGKVYFRRRGRIASGSLRDLSFSGCAVLTRSPLPPGAEVPLGLELSGMRTIRIIARVVWCRQADPYAMEGEACMGVAFQHLEPEDRRLLSTFLSRVSL